MVGAETVTETALMRWAEFPGFGSRDRATLESRVSARGLRFRVLLRCWSGDHLAVGVLSVAVLVLLVLGMPLFSFVYIRNRLRSAASFRCNESGHVTGCVLPYVRAHACAYVHLRWGAVCRTQLTTLPCQIRLNLESHTCRHASGMRAPEGA
jgi:hypothetical protein